VSAVQSGNLGEISTSVLWDFGASCRECLWEGEWLRLIAPIFLHGGLPHILLNSVSLWYLGPSAEVYFGTYNYGTLYVVSGIAGFCFSQIFGGNLAIGASCSLFGILGAALMAKVQACPVPMKAWRNSEVRALAYFLLFYLAIGFVGLLGNVDNWGHLGGLLAGVALGGLFELWRRRRHISYGLGITALLLCAAVVCAARWPVYNPYYHVHMAVVAEEDKRAVDAASEWKAAQDWAKTWGSEKSVALLLAAHEAGIWTVQDARTYGYRYILHYLHAPRYRVL
jgi:membrane associated rhomboid family serine protease